MPEIVCEFVDEPDTQLTNLGAKGLGEPPIVPVAAAIANAIRDATGADVRSLPITREEMLNALREARERGEEREAVELRASRLASTAVEPRRAAGGRHVHRGRHGGRAAAPRRAARGGHARRRARPAAARHRRHAHRRRRRRSPSSRRPTGSRTRCARPRASPRRRSSAAWARSPATCSRRRAAGTGGSKLPCRLHGGDRCLAADGEHREHAIFANDFCASAHPSDLAAALLALGATLRTNRRELPVAELYRVPTEDDRRTTTLEPGELILELDVPPADASVYLKAMERKRWSFPIVGVAAVRRGGETTVALAGVAPIPWLLEGTVDDATPLPGNAYKVEIAGALVRRALAAVAASIARRCAASLLALLCLVPALALAGCGGDDDATARRRGRRHDDDDDRTATTATTTTTALRRLRRGHGARPASAPSTSRRAARRVEDLRGHDRDELRQLHDHARPGAVAEDDRVVRRRSSKQGYFDDTVFHRIVPGFVIQGGDPTATGSGGPGYSTVDTPPADATYTHGVVAMAKTRGRGAGHGGQPVLRRDRDRRGRCRRTTRSSARSPTGSTSSTRSASSAAPTELPTQVVEIEKATVTES